MEKYKYLLILSFIFLMFLSCNISNNSIHDYPQLEIGEQYIFNFSGSIHNTQSTRGVVISQSNNGWVKVKYKNSDVIFNINLRNVSYYYIR